MHVAALQYTCHLHVSMQGIGLPRCCYVRYVIGKWLSGVHLTNCLHKFFADILAQVCQLIWLKLS